MPLPTGQITDVHNPRTDGDVVRYDAGRRTPALRRPAAGCSPPPRPSPLRLFASRLFASSTCRYDACGNRTTRTLGGTTIYSTYDDNNKLSYTGTTAGDDDLAVFTYDNNGNITGVTGTMYGTRTMAYNDGNFMTSITYSGVTDYYYYAHDGQRYRARLAGTYYQYLYNGERVLEELSDAGSMQARYTTESGSYYDTLLHLYRSDGASRFPMYDNIGTVRGLMDASGTITDAYELDTFGRPVSSTGTTLNPYRFGGAWGYITDPSGMAQLGMRHYWPEVGRFVSQDPKRNGENWYAYTEGNPVTGADPEGLETCVKDGKYSDCKVVRATGKKGNKKKCENDATVKRMIKYLPMLVINECAGRKVKNCRPYEGKREIGLAAYPGATCWIQCTLKGQICDVCEEKKK